MRDRLIELLKRADKYASGVCTDYDEAQEVCADFLLAEGVIVPPCKVGDTVWIAGEYRGVYSATVRTFFFSHCDVEMIRTTKCDIPFSDFGKTVFLTREEAEKALAERSKNDNT